MTIIINLNLVLRLKYNYYLFYKLLNSMSQLTQMRLRINAIHTIKKITHAMRLISMSLHTRLQKQSGLRDLYQSELFNLLNITQEKINSLNNKKNKNVLENNIKNKNKLIIIIGAQKGLCGSYNNNILKYFLNNNLDSNNLDLIILGNKIKTNLSSKDFNIIKTIYNFKSSNINLISNDLLDFIELNKHKYSSIICYYNHPHSFFLQKPTISQIFPVINKQNNSKTNINSFSPDYLWEESPENILKYLTKEYLFYNLETILFNALLSEQAARFRSMDRASRNAKELLDIMEKNYNKLRQQKITQELLELITPAK